MAWAIVPEQSYQNVLEWLFTSYRISFQSHTGLWGERGQIELQKANVCLINATATSTELLKNLILPGIGSFEIIDNKIVTGEDIGNNFFLVKDSLGKFRGKCATSLLLELNEDVNGTFHEQKVDDLVEYHNTYFKNFTIVIATELSIKLNLRLASILRDYGIPYVYIRTCGFIGSIRVVLNNHTVIESQPDNKIEDLRLSDPFPELTEYCDTFDLNTMSKSEHAHTPWVIIMHKYLTIWRKEHNGMNPKDYKEKNLLKNIIRDASLINEEGTQLLEENIEEAIKNTNLALAVIKVPNSFEEIKASREFKNINSESKIFWILANALNKFIINEGKGLLPLRGSIPDMTSDSKRYIELQKIYQRKAQSDCKSVNSHLQIILNQISQNEKHIINPASNSPTKPKDTITDRDVKLFCCNAEYIRVIHTRSLADEYKSILIPTEEIANQLQENYDYNEMVYYVMLRASEIYYESKTQMPGEDINSENCLCEFKQCVNQMLLSWGVNCLFNDEYIREFCRFGGSELHSVGAFIGGTSAQEVIKIITHQFIPINNTFIYNAIKQTTSTFEM